MNPKDPDHEIGRRTFVRASGIGIAAGIAGAAFAPLSAMAAEGDSAISPPGPINNVKTFGAKGDNATDDTAAIQAAIDAASKAGGGFVFLPAGYYKTTAGLQCTSNNVVIAGIGGASTIRPVGDFDTLRFVGPGPTHIYRNRVADLLFDERDKTGGRTIVGEYVSLFIVERVYGVFGWNAWHFHNFGYVTLTECRFESYRGTCYGRASGGGAGKDKGRSDILRMIGLTHGGTRKDGIIGIDIDGYVHTVCGQGIYLVGIGAQGLWARNTIGAENNPSFFTFDDFECDFPDLECIRLDAGEHFYFSNTEIHATRSAASNIHIGPKVKGVAFTGGFSTGAQRAGINIEGRDVTLSAMRFHANSNPQFGGVKNVYPGILVGKTARGVIVTGCRSGHGESPDFQAAGCQIDENADDFVITGNDFRYNVRRGVDSQAGVGPSKVIANNIGS